LLRPRIDGSALVFDATASPTLGSRLHALGGHREGRLCKVPLHRVLDFEDLLGYGGIEKDDAYLDARFRVFFGADRAEQEQRATLLHQDPGTLGFPGLKVPLYPYQARAVRFLQRARRGILGDEPGLGKTLQAIAWAVGEGPTLVVCPAGVVGVWEAEVAGKSTATIAAVRGVRPAPMPGTDFVVVSFAVLHAHLDAVRARGFRSIVVDEAHFIKDPRSQRSKAVAAAAQGIGRRLFLSGSLLLRNAEDLFAVLRLVRPDDFPTLAAFRARYCRLSEIRAGGRKVKRVVGSQRTAELRTRLEPWMAARRLAEVVDDLPPLTEQTLHVELLPDQLQRYRAWLQRMRSQAPRSRDGLSAFQEAMRVLQEAKTAAASAILEDLWFSERKALAFSHHLEPLEALETKPWQEMAVRLTGAVSPEERTRRVARFQSDPRVRLALCQLEAAGVGITLDAADTVLMVDPGWTPALVDQAVRRARRVTTRHPVHVIHFVVPKTLDESRWERMRDRRAALDDLHGAQGVELAVYESAMAGLLAT
jgi:SNF2 family DNA or RNA helicase